MRSNSDDNKTGLSEAADETRRGSTFHGSASSDSHLFMYRCACGDRMSSEAWIRLPETNNGSEDRRPPVSIHLMLIPGICGASGKVAQGNRLED